MGSLPGGVCVLLALVAHTPRLAALFGLTENLLTPAGGCWFLAGNLLKPQLARGELRCIGATTLDEYRKYIEKDPALERRFQQV